MKSEAPAESALNRKSVELVSRIRARDESAWRDMSDQYESLLPGIARQCRLLAEDIDDVVQLTWLHCLEHINQLTDPHRLGGWLTTICRRGMYPAGHQGSAGSTTQRVRPGTADRWRPRRRRPICRGLGSWPDRSPLQCYVGLAGATKDAPRRTCSDKRTRATSVSPDALASLWAVWANSAAYCNPATARPRRADLSSEISEVHLHAWSAWRYSPCPWCWYRL